MNIFKWRTIIKVLIAAATALLGALVGKDMPDETQ